MTRFCAANILALFVCACAGVPAQSRGPEIELAYLGSDWAGGSDGFELWRLSIENNSERTISLPIADSFMLEGVGCLPAVDWGSVTPERELEHGGWEVAPASLDLMVFPVPRLEIKSGQRVELIVDALVPSKASPAGTGLFRVAMLTDQTRYVSQSFRPISGGSGAGVAEAVRCELEQVDR